jgi:phosphoesterase RecJ-like protein
MIYTDPIQAAPAIAALLKPAQRILLLTHLNPDGDAIGSLLGIWHFLQGQHKIVIPIVSSPLPGYARVLPGVEHVQIYDRGMTIPDHDVIILLDASTLERTGVVYEDHASRLQTRPLLIIDHHVVSVGEGVVNLINPASASCAELIYRLLRALHTPVTPAIATCLLLGITTDTQSFQTSSTSAQTLRTTADLLEAQADQQAIIRSVYYTKSYQTIRMIGASLNQMQRDGDLIWVTISQQMMQQSGAEDDAYDDIIQLMQRTEGVRVCIMFKERQNGETKISLRSIPGIDVAAIARRWGGGGHAQAAGATLRMPCEEAQREVIPLLKECLANE